MIRFYRLINILSIDVAAGAVICSTFFARALQLELAPLPFVCLGLTVWIIYTADHLIDAINLKAEAITVRHQFHQRYFKLLMFMSATVFVIDCILVYRLDYDLRSMGLVLAILVVFYFLVQRRLKYLKEILGSLLYTTGIILPAISSSSGIVSVQACALIVFMILLALINLVLFSLFDKNDDRLQDHKSIVLTLGEGRSKRLLVALFVLTFIINIYLLFSPIAEIFSTTAMLMTCLLLIIFLWPRWFLPHNRYRIFGDAVFLLPLIVISVR